MDRNYGVSARDTLLSMDGLTFMENVLSGKLPGPPMARTMNIFVHDVARGRVAFRGAPTDDHLNPMGTTHGGWFGAILDSALGCAAMTVVPQGSVYTTLEFKVNLARGISPGTEVEALATVDHAGRTTVVASASLTGVADGRTFATATTTCLIMKITD